MANAFFDFDKTIINCDSLISFLFFYVYKKPSKIPYLFFIFLAAVLYKLKIIGNQKIKEIVSGIFKNEKVECMSLIGSEFAEKIIPGFYYKDAICAIEKHKKQGDNLILVTASYNLYISHVAKNLGFNQYMGSELWRYGDTYTGKLYGKNCYGMEKRYRLLSEGYKDSDVLENYSYSDSITDLPLFKFAAIKICVNPDKKLYKHALSFREEGYKIVNWK